MPDDADIRRLFHRITERGEPIGAAWAAFRLRVIPAGYDPEDVDVMRLCFFAGASSVFMDLTEALAADGYTPPDALLRRIQQMSREVHDYVDDLECGPDLAPPPPR